MSFPPQFPHLLLTSLAGAGGASRAHKGQALSLSWPGVPSMAGCSCRSGQQPPSMIVGCLHLQETTPTPSGSPSSTKASRVLRFSGVTMEFSFDPGDTMTTQALLDPITDVPCPRRGHTCSPSGWLWGCWCWDASISPLLGSNRLHPLKCPSPYVLVGYILLC